MTTINTIDDLVRILRERPEWLRVVRELVLTEELLRLPETVAKLAEELREYARQTNERLGRLEVDVTELKTDVAELKTDVAELKIDVAELKTDVAGLKTEQTRTSRRLGRVENQVNELRGDVMEITAAKRIVPTIIQQLELYHCDTIIGPGLTLSQERINEIRQAEIAGTIERNSDQEVAQVDFLMRGRRNSDNEPVWVAIEASAKIDEHDITRSRRRADILTAVYHESAIAVVVRESIDERDRVRAETADVRVIALRPRYRAEE